MYGIDISEHQKGIDLRLDTFDFVIVKATEGATYIDPQFDNYIKQLSQLDCLIGCYHFARPDNQDTIKTIQQEADNFLSVMNRYNLVGKAILILDWEREPIDRVDLAKAWLDRVYSTTNVRPLIYSYSHFFKTYWPYKDYDIWGAYWQSNWTRLYSPHIPYEIPDDDWKIWQYSCKGIIRGYDGEVDLDYCPFTSLDWNKWAGRRISSEMYWAIENGLIIGDGNGNYQSNANITKEQLAIVLKRFYDKLIDG